MRILIDATCIKDHPDGWGRYALCLLESLAAQDNTNEYTVLLQKKRLKNKEHPVFKLGRQKNFKLKRTSFRAAGLSREIKFFISNLGRDYDIFHCMSSYLPIFQKYKSIVTVHDLKFIKHPYLFGSMGHAKHKYIKYLMESGLTQSSKIIAVSKSTRKDIVDMFGIEKNKIEVIYESTNIIPCTGENILNKVLNKYNIKKPYFFHIGVGSPHKNIKGAIDGFTCYKKKYGARDVNLVIAGLFLNAKKVKKDSSIKFIGPIPDEDLPALYSGAQGFIFVSFYEGFGLPILEAMKCRTPVITSNTSSLPEIAGGAALLADPRSPAKIAEKINHIMSSDDLRKDLIERGLKRVQEFSWHDTASRTLKIYKSLGA